MKPNEWEKLSSLEKERIWSSLSEIDQETIRVAAALKKQQSASAPYAEYNDLLEYRILSQRDSLFSGRFDAESITDVLNKLAVEGWRLVAVTSSGVNTLLGGNRDEVLIFLERKRKPVK
jgi:hypothetical protein